MNNMEIMTFTDKWTRDSAYQDLRKNGDSLERQVVKFSSCEAVIGDDVQSINEAYTTFKYRSTWSLAYPRS